MVNIFKHIKINTKLFCKILIIFSILMKLLIDQFYFPNVIKYFNDLLLIFSVILLGRYKIKIKKECPYVLFFIIIYLIVSFVSSFLNFTSPLLFLWALRNTFRGIIYFILIIEVFNNKDIYNLFKFFFIIQWFSLMFALYQFFILKHHQDFIGGIFGYGDGASLNAFNAMMISYYLSGYLLGKEKNWKLISTLSISIIISALAEEKLSFLFLPIIILVCVMLCKSSIYKKIYISLFVLFIFMCGLLIIYVLYPEMFETIINLEELFNYSQTTYDEGYRLPRIGSISIITDLFFHNDLFNTIFGIGFGGAETSSFSFLQSNFYKVYGDYNYRWFTIQWLFIEQGYLGFISYLLIFLSIFFSLSYKKMKSNVSFDSRLIVVSIIMSIYAIISIWYNSSLKNDSQYLIYFGLSLGFILPNRKKGVIYE